MIQCTHAHRLVDAVALGERWGVDDSQRDAVGGAGHHGHLGSHIGHGLDVKNGLAKHAVDRGRLAGKCFAWVRHA